jgi:hypothetical protein
LAAATNGFSPADVGGDGGVAWGDEAASAGVTEAGAAAGVPSLRKLSLYFVFASSVAETAGLTGTAGGIPATGDGFFAGTGPEDGAAGAGAGAAGAGAAGAGAAVVGAAEGSSRNLSLMTGLAVAGADAETAGLPSVA